MFFEIQGHLYLIELHSDSLTCNFIALYSFPNEVFVLGHDLSLIKSYIYQASSILFEKQWWLHYSLTLIGSNSNK